MPFDKYFQSSWKRQQSEGAKQRAAHKARWPEGSQFRPSVKLEMRGKNGIEPADWWHFLNVPDNCAQAELKAWSEQNREHEFRVEP